MKERLPFIHVLLPLLVLMLLPQTLGAQTVENEFQSRTEIKLSYKLLDNIKLSVTPEVRLDESFNMDKFLLETGIQYKPVKFLSVGGSYRFIANTRDTKSTEYLHRFALDATFSKKIERWKPSLRIRYTNYTEDDANSDFLRYKAKVEYNIKNIKLSPVVGIEAFHELGDNEFYKMRYTLGMGYKFNKKNSISAGYKLDYYLQEYLNKHILYVGYKFNF